VSIAMVMLIRMIPMANPPSSVGKPLELLALYPNGPTQPYKQGEGCRDEQTGSHGVHNRFVDVGEAFYTERVPYRAKRTLIRSRRERSGDHPHQDINHRQPRQPRGGTRAQSASSSLSILFACPLRHDPTLQDDRLPTVTEPVTKPSGNPGIYGGA
jgi:hypothetical protein